MAGTIDLKQENKDLLTLIRDVPAWVWAFIAIIIGILKLTIVAHGDTITMLILANATSITGIILSSLIAALGTVVSAWIFYWMIDLTEIVREGGRIGVSLSAMILGLILGALFLPKLTFFYSVVFITWMISSGLAIRYLWPYIKRKIFRSKKAVRFSPVIRTTRGYFIVSFLLLGPITLVPLLSDKPWIPLEEITTINTRTIGYVIETDNTSTKVLQDQTRDIILIPNENVKSRSICVPNDQAFSRSVFSSLWANYRLYKKCERLTPPLPLATITQSHDHTNQKPAGPAAAPEPLRTGFLSLR